MTKPIDADLTGNVAVVTGANSGIGLATASALAAMGAQVVMVCRSAERGQAAIDDIQSVQPDARLELAQIDLSDFESIRAGTDAILRRHSAIHVLVNNAALWLPDRRENPAGVELIWATNVLGPYLLTERLRVGLRAGAPARVVNVTSVMVRGMDLDDPEFETRTYNGLTAYGQSKRANRMWSWDLAQRLADDGITVNAIHPGGVGTNLGRHHPGWFGWAFTFWGRWLARTPEKGADTVVWLSASPDVAGETGQYWVDRRARNCPYRDPAEISRLRSLCEAATAG